MVGAALASAFIPGVGPVIAGGLLVSIVSGAMAGVARTQRQRLRCAKIARFEPATRAPRW